MIYPVSTSFVLLAFVGTRPMTLPEDDPPEQIRASCAQHCLYIVGKLLQCDVSLTRIHSFVPLDGQPRSLADIREGATNLGLVSEPVQWPHDGLASVVSPTILHVVVKGSHEPHHFVVVLPYDNDKVVLVDHPHAPSLVSWEEIHRVWTGRALHVAKSNSELQPVRSAVSYARVHRFISWWAVISVTCLFAAILAGRLRTGAR